ncbi:AMP-binding protein [Hydrocarboniclastica marina]|uniref:AMP-binding protein n=1 Tax=Hydrocarboniclastica marina TaxID=2259620 RepID=UPI001561D3E9|nr:AMP-binding protein [Hydrocarboniclastica marina]
MSTVPESIPALLQQMAIRQPDVAALVSPDLSLSYGQTWAAVMELAYELRKAGTMRLGLCGDNSPAWVIADLACLLADVVCVPVPGFFSPTQTGHLIRSAGLDGLLWPDQGTAGSQRVKLSSFAWLEPLAAGHNPHSVPYIHADTAKVTFTSGSTGSPKGVCLSARHLSATTLALRDRLHGLGLARHASVLPLATLLENIAGVYLSLSMGATIELLPLQMLGMNGSSGLDADQFIDQLRRVRPHSLILVPELAAVLVNAAAGGALDGHRFRFLAVGGGRVPPALLDEARRLGLPLYEGYGLSECGSVVALSTPGNERPGSVGKPLGHLHVSVDGKGDRSGGEQGEIAVSGNSYLGYLGSAPPSDGLLQTGDLGRLDGDGYLYIEGRKKNLLITSFGRNISPEWLESELCLATGARQALVFGDGEPQPSAILALSQGGLPACAARKVEIESVIRRLNATLPDYARLRRIYLLHQPLSHVQGYVTANGRLVRSRILEHLGLILPDAQLLDLLQREGLET